MSPQRPYWAHTVAAAAICLATLFTSFYQARAASVVCRAEPGMSDIMETVVTSWLCCIVTRSDTLPPEGRKPHMQLALVSSIDPQLALQ